MREKVSRAFTEAYIRHTLTVARSIHDYTERVPLFGEYFVALECSVGAWWGFRHYRLMEEWQYRAATKCEPAGLAYLQGRHDRFMAQWEQYGYPFIDGYAWRRAIERRNLMYAALGQPPEDEDELRRDQGADAWRWVASREPVNQRWLANADWFNRREPDGPPPAGEPGRCRCPAAFGAHRDRHCILCAVPWVRQVVEGGFESDRVATHERSGEWEQSRRRLSVCVGHLQHVGIGEQTLARLSKATPAQRDPAPRSRDEDAHG